MSKELNDTIQKAINYINLNRNKNVSGLDHNQVNTLKAILMQDDFYDDMYDSEEIEKLNNDATHLLELHKRTLEERNLYYSIIKEVRERIEKGIFVIPKDIDELLEILDRAGDIK